jgi:plastocyanin
MASKSVVTPLALFLLASAAAFPAVAETIKVDVNKMVYSPETISVHVGDRIEWNNSDIVMHNITTKGGLISIDMPVNGKVSIGMAKEGTIEYYCKFHPNMKGKIEVTR